MFKLILWLAGAVGFLVVISHQGYWHEAAALAVLCGAFLWIVGGAAMLSRGGAALRAGAVRKMQEAAELRRSAEQAQRKQETAGGA